MQTITIGQPAPDITLTQLDGRSQPMSAYWQENRAVLFIFLRHLA
jgi:peroxiredoxin